MGNVPLPWTIPPSYASLVAFDINMVMPDLLHCWNLGVSRDVLGSALKIILSEREIFDGPSVADRLKQASESLRAYAKANHYSLRTKKLTKAKLSWKSRAYPCLGVSGFDSVVISHWVEDLVSQGDKYPQIHTLLWLSNRAIGLLYHGGQFLTNQEKNSLETLGFAFLRVYMHQTREALQQHKLLWRVRPKMHLMCHVFRSARKMNPSRFATWMDENFLRFVKRTLVLTDCRGSQYRFLQRWLMALRFHLSEQFGPTI